MKLSECLSSRATHPLKEHFHKGGKGQLPGVNPAQREVIKGEEGL